MTRHFKFWTLAFATACLSLLSGCSSMRVIESKVQTSTQWTTAAPTQALFRLERLPADAHNLQAGWAEVELESALAPLGWTRNDAQAQYSVWIGVRAAEFIADPWGRPVQGPWVSQVHVSMGNGYRPRGTGVGVGWGIGMSNVPYPGVRPGFPAPLGYTQEVSILIRDLQTSNVVYQTKATHEGPWADHATIVRVMIGAALQGFPSPSAVKRSVNTSIAR